METIDIEHPPVAGSLISIRDLGPEETVALASAVASGASPADLGIHREALVAAIFFNQSLRTRLGLLRACSILGATFVDLAPDRIYTPAMGHAASPYSEETVGDVVNVLDRHVDCVAIRAYGPGHGVPLGGGDRLMTKVAQLSAVPLLNLESDSSHPVQGLADLATIMDAIGRPEKRRLVVAWAYSPEPKPIAVPSSAVMAAAAAGMCITIASPEEFRLPSAMVALARSWAERSGGSLDECHTLADASTDCDVLYMKSWLSSSGLGEDHASVAARHAEWRATADVFGHSDCRYMHCLPADRGLEVDDDVIDGPRSLVWRQVEMRREVSVHLLARALCSLSDPDRGVGS